MSDFVYGVLVLSGAVVLGMMFAHLVLDWFEGDDGWR